MPISKVPFAMALQRLHIEDSSILIVVVESWNFTDSLFD